MVAYSFKRQFVDPIKVGLGLRGSELARPIVPPKRQTIRADRKRHARPGEELQLYCGMRTRHCFLIGRAKCLAVRGIHLVFDARTILIERAEMSAIKDWLLYRDADAFARSDGFKHFEEMQAFWDAEHGVAEFTGFLIQWEPL